MDTRAERTRDHAASSDDELDRRLLQRVADGDRAALTLLYQRYQSPILRFVQRLTGDTETAHEAVNDVMLVVWKRAATFSGRSKVSTWVMGIAYRKAMKLGARMRRWSERFKAADWTHVFERSQTLEGLTKELVERDLMNRAIQQLPDKQRAVVELTYYFGYSYDEIAEIVDCPPNTVKTRVYHARARLRKLLPQLGYEFDD